MEEDSRASGSGAQVNTSATVDVVVESDDLLSNSHDVATSYVQNTHTEEWPEDGSVYGREEIEESIALRKGQNVKGDSSGIRGVRSSSSQVSLGDVTSRLDRLERALTLFLERQANPVSGNRADARPVDVPTSKMMRRRTQRESLELQTPFSQRPLSEVQQLRARTAAIHASAKISANQSREARQRTSSDSTKSFSRRETTAEGGNRYHPDLTPEMKVGGIEPGVSYKNLSAGMPTAVILDSSLNIKEPKWLGFHVKQRRKFGQEVLKYQRKLGQAKINGRNVQPKTLAFLIGDENMHFIAHFAVLPEHRVDLGGCYNDLSLEVLHDYVFCIGDYAEDEDEYREEVDEKFSKLSVNVEAPGAYDRVTKFFVKIVTMKRRRFNFCIHKDGSEGDSEANSTGS